MTKTLSIIFASALFTFSGCASPAPKGAIFICVTPAGNVSGQGARVSYTPSEGVKFEMPDGKAFMTSLSNCASWTE